MPEPASWYRSSERHLAADLGRAGSLLVWLDNASASWAILMPGVQKAGFATSADAQAAAIHLAREQLEEGLRRLAALELSAALDNARARPR